MSALESKGRGNGRRSLKTIPHLPESCCGTFQLCPLLSQEFTTPFLALPPDGEYQTAPRRSDGQAASLPYHPRRRGSGKDRPAAVPSADTTDQFHKLVSGSPLRGNQNVAIVSLFLSLLCHLNGVTNRKNLPLAVKVVIYIPSNLTI